MSWFKLFIEYLKDPENFLGLALGVIKNDLVMILLLLFVIYRIWRFYCQNQQKIENRKAFKEIISYQAKMGLYVTKLNVNETMAEFSKLDTDNSSPKLKRAS